MRVMRVLLVFALLLTSGCLQGSPSKPTSNFQSTCPSWTEGTPGGGYSGRFTNAFAEASFGDHNHIGTGKLSYSTGGGDRPLDMVQIDFHWSSTVAGGTTHWQPHYVYVVNGTMEGRIYREDTGEQVMFTRLEDGPNAMPQDVMRFPAGYHTNFTMSVHLAPTTGETNPGALHINWLLVPSQTVGRADAAIDYLVTLWYRNC